MADEEREVVQFRDKDVVLFKNIIREAIETELAEREEKGEELDPNALASRVAITVFHNLGVASEATVAWFKWLRESGKIR